MSFVTCIWMLKLPQYHQKAQKIFIHGLLYKFESKRITQMPLNRPHAAPLFTTLPVKRRRKTNQKISCYKQITRNWKEQYEKAKICQETRL